MLIDKGYSVDITYRVFNDTLLEFQWVRRPIEKSNKCLCLIGLPSHPSTWKSCIENNLDNIKKSDKILLHARPENYTFEDWQSIIDIIINLGKKETDLLIIDNNCISPIKHVQHITDYQVFSAYSLYNKLNYTDIHNRNYEFISLAGIATPNRVLFTKELLVRKLQNKGIITCGSASAMKEDVANIIFDYLNLGEYRSCFPMIYDKKFNSLSNSIDVNLSFLDAKFNVVLETCYEDVSDLKQHPEIGHHPSVNRTSNIFVTEKTMKAFAYYQIPIFLASKGYVAEIRKLGFDLFDDIINHTYDDIKDPCQRLVAVADEVNRIVNIDISDNKLKDRLINNHNKIKELYFKQKHRISMNILEWFNQ